MPVILKTEKISKEYVLAFFYKVYNYIILLYNKPKIKSDLKQLSKYHTKNFQIDFSDIIDNSIESILTYAMDNCPYYTELFKVNNINPKLKDDFSRIPFLDKAIIANNYKSIQSGEIIKTTNYIMNTGGTTGEPLTFPVSSHFDHEHQEFIFNIMGYNSGDRIISFDGTKISEKNVTKGIFWKKDGYSSLPYGNLCFSTLHLFNNTSPVYIEKLNRVKPKYIRGYPTALNSLAVYMLDNNIRFNFQLKAVLLTAESIIENQIYNIRKAFECKVHLEYGHSEVSVFAYTVDDTYQYFCSPYYGFTEVIGSNDLHVNVGEIGEIVVTGFYNRSLPFIRYRTGDIAVYNGNESGIVRLNKIYGRNQDFLYDSAGERIFLVGLIHGGHHGFFDNIKKWQIIQNKTGCIEILIIKGKYFSLQDELDIKDLFFNNYKIRSIIKYVDKIDYTMRGKNRLVVQNVDIVSSPDRNIL